MALLYPAGQQFGDSNMDPVSSGSLYVYETGTTTLASIYSDTGLTATLTNPVVLDSSGRVPSNIYVADTVEFTVEVKTSGNAQVFSRDNVFGWASTGAASSLVISGSSETLTLISNEISFSRNNLNYLTLDGGSSAAFRIRDSSNDELFQVTANDSTDIYFGTILKLKSADETASGNSSGAVVKDGGGVLRPIGFNMTPITSLTGSTPLRQANVGHCLLSGSSGENLTIDTTTDNAPNGSVWVFMNKSGNSQTITPSGVNLFWLDGAGGQTGTRTVADGSYVTVTKSSTSNYNLVGNGIS